MSSARVENSARMIRVQPVQPEKNIDKRLTYDGKILENSTLFAAQRSALRTTYVGHRRRPELRRGVPSCFRGNHSLAAYAPPDGTPSEGAPRQPPAPRSRWTIRAGERSGRGMSSRQSVPRGALTSASKTSSASTDKKNEYIVALLCRLLIRRYDMHGHAMCRGDLVGTKYTTRD